MGNEREVKEEEKEIECHPSLVEKRRNVISVSQFPNTEGTGEGEGSQERKIRGIDSYKVNRKEKKM